MKIHRCLPLVILAATSTIACDPDAVELDLGEVSLRPGGVWLNTSLIGSKEFAEFDLTGQLHDGVQLVGVWVSLPNDEWALATSSEVIDGEMYVHVGPVVYSGAQLLDSRWRIAIPDYFGEEEERVVDIWISAYTQVSANEGRYTFQTPGEGGQPNYVCTSDADGEFTAIPVRDVSVNRETGDMTARPHTAYLACTSGAVGKAILWGYKPWERALAEFEAASRMVRADYCFNGTSWTEEGNHLQVRDAYEINDFLLDASTEVVWTSSGVACIGQPRSQYYTAAQVICDGQVVPACPVGVSLATYPNALFWTKLAPQ